MLSKIYLILGIVLIAGYALFTITGREFGDPQKQKMPADVRQSPGGYRSFHVFAPGYRGGK
ncbi:MAG TPA: hypothetical protein VKM94_17100 [Blastocatellia bacterium]|nr:hypothetical protein [Blastocatellia bacterium]